jgi:hypothetical protein
MQKFRLKRKGDKIYYKYRCCKAVLTEVADRTDSTNSGTSAPEEGDANGSTDAVTSKSAGSGNDGQCDCAKCPRLPGFVAAYYQIEGDVKSVDDIPTKMPDYSSTCLDIDFARKEFLGIAEAFPEDHFAARWKGEMQVLEGGVYTFYVTSDDGSKVFVDNSLVADYDGLHGAEEWKHGTIQLNPGWHAVKVEYFEIGGEQKIQVKYSGPDTFGKIVFLRGYHIGIIPVEDPDPPDRMFPGFVASYFKIDPKSVRAVPDIRGLEPFLTAVSIDVDYDKNSFKTISEELQNSFAARWTGNMKVTKGGTYTFFSNSDDGSLVIVNNEVVVKNDGLHSMEKQKEGTIDLDPGFYPVTIDFFQVDGDVGIQVKYSGPDTSGKETTLFGQHAKAQEGNLCEDDYQVKSGASGSWGKIGNRGGGEKVEDCSICASVCDGIPTCRSYECSPTELRCNVNTASKPTHEEYKDYSFCEKKASAVNRQMVLGWEAKYSKLENGIQSLPDMRGRKFEWNGTTVDIDFDAEAFHSISKEFPQVGLP